MREQAAEKSAYSLRARLGDEELFEDLRLGLNFFNTIPPIVAIYSFEDLYSASAMTEAAGGDPKAPEIETAYSVLSTTVMMCALFFVGLRLQWFEAGKHFQYNDNGISLIRDKQPKYQAIAGGNILQYLTVTLPLIKKQLGFGVSAKGMFSGMVAFPRSLTRGLRGTRLGR